MKTIFVPNDMADVVSAVVLELSTALNKFPSFNSGHEGYAVIKEELDELWDEVKSKTSTLERQDSEAMQVAAMGMRYMLDVTRNEG